MTGTTMLDPVGLGYLAEVGAALADLEPSERGELLDEVQEHLISIIDDVDELTREQLVARLGPPSRYAAELLRAAGLEPVLAPSPNTTSMLQVALRARLVAVVWAYLRRLEPAWWAVRGYLIAGVLIPVGVPIRIYYYYSNSPQPINLFRHWLPEGGAVYGTFNRLWIIVPVLAVVVGSVAVGLHGERHTASGRFWNRVLDIGGVVGLVFMPTWWIGPAVYGYVASR